MDVEEKLEDLIDTMEDMFKDRFARLDFQRWDDQPKEKLVRIATILQFVSIIMVTEKNLVELKKEKNIEKIWNTLANCYKKSDLIMNRMNKLFYKSWIEENFADVWEYRFWFTSLRKMLTADGEIRISANPRITKLQAAKFMKHIKETYKNDKLKAKNDQNKNVVDSIEGLHSFLLSINRKNILLGDNSIKAEVRKALATEKRLSSKGYA